MPKSDKKILMLGWEFPPIFSGGLGVVTKNLAESLTRQGVDITLILPQFIAQKVLEQNYNSNVKLLTFTKNQTPSILENIKILNVPTLLSSPYTYFDQYQKFYHHFYKKNNKTPRDITVYGKNLFEEVHRFSLEVLMLTENQNFDLTHAHDWITAEAAIQLKIKRKIPYVLHIHATEIDRTGNVNPLSEIFRREKFAMEFADRLITVSGYTKRLLIEHYGIPEKKISVVYNAYETKNQQTEAEKSKIWKKDKSQFWVLFIGRVTLQKGPNYFLETAKKVVSLNRKIHFLIAGEGDMLPEITEKIKTYRLEKNVHCLGFVSPEKRDALYMFADACIIPSVSEPFGLTAIEVIDHCTPLIISKNCGANEIIHHKLEVDFWDTDKMAEYVLALQKHPALRRTLREKAMKHRSKLTWEAQARRVVEVYGTMAEVDS